MGNILFLDLGGVCFEKFIVWPTELHNYVLRTFLYVCFT